MRRIRCAFMALFVLLALALMPARAFAGIEPHPNEIYIDGTPLSEKTPKNVSYNESTGTLTLKNYNGGPIKVVADGSRPSGDQELRLIVNLEGSSIISSKGGGFSSAISVTGFNYSENWANTLIITSEKGGSLTIYRTFEQDHSDDVSFYGIAAGGDVRITGKVSVSVFMNTGDVQGTTNSVGHGVIVAGIQTSRGYVTVEDEANLTISVTSNGAMHSAGIMMEGDENYFVVSTIKPVTIDLSKADSSGKTGEEANYPGVTVGVDASKTADPFKISNSPMVTVKANSVCHTVTGNKLSNPKAYGYDLETVAGQYTDTHTYTRKSPFKDVDYTTPHFTDILWLYENGISTGFQDGTYQPFSSVARCDMAAFLYRLAGSPAFTPTAKDKAYFSDVDESTPHAKEVWWLAHEGISKGWTEEDGTHTFRPYAHIARCDMAAFLYRLAGSPAFTPSAKDKNAFTDVSASTPHAKEVWWLASMGISTGFSDGTFRPYDEIARCDMAAFLHRMEDKSLV